MKLTPQENDHLRQLMDACRPGSDDLSRPEMAALAAALGQDAAMHSEWESRQRSDRRLAGAMHDVSVPPGLAERILAAAERARAPLQKTVAQAVASERDSADAEPAAGTRITPRASRRRVWQGLAAAAVLMLAMAAAWHFLLRPPQTVTRGQLEASAQGWFQQALQPATRSAANVQPPVPFPRRDVALPLQSWHRMRTAEEPSLVAFDLTRRGSQGSMFLFAARTRKQYEVRSVPYTPLTRTGGLQMGAWQQGDVLYVLVVDVQNSGVRLDDLLRDPKMAMLLLRQP